MAWAPVLISGRRGPAWQQQHPEPCVIDFLRYRPDEVAAYAGRGDFAVAAKHGLFLCNKFRHMGRARFLTAPALRRCGRQPLSLWPGAALEHLRRSPMGPSANE